MGLDQAGKGTAATVTYAEESAARGQWRIRNLTAPNARLLSCVHLAGTQACMLVRFVDAICSKSRMSVHSERAVLVCACNQQQH